MRFGLKKHVILKIQSVFKKYDEIEKVFVYGSRAKGNFNKGSDIDLTIVGKSNALKILQKIENELDDLLLPYTIDLSYYNQISNKDLTNHIDRVGILFYQR